MNKNNSYLALSSINGALMEQQVADKILACNQYTAVYGLTLTQQQAVALAHTRTSALKDSKRIEFNSGIIDKIIMAFCNSPYISNENYEDIERYLRCIEAENEFCMHFAPQDIHHLLCGLTQDYRSIPMNLFEPVFLSALGLAILHRNPEQLDLSREDIVSLHRFFSKKSEQEIQFILENMFCDLDRKMELPEISKRYIHLCIPKFTKTIHKSVALKTMDKVFLVPSYPERESKITISYGERMEDTKYQELVERILQANDGKDKVDLILQEVHSLADLLDILSDAELYKEEFDLLINLLPAPVFAALLNQFPNDDFLERESEKLLYNALQSRKQHISPEEMRQIKKITAALKNGNIDRE